MIKSKFWGTFELMLYLICYRASGSVKIKRVTHVAMIVSVVMVAVVFCYMYFLGT
jgi:hypothetical protein